jgi:hypothetical protein
MLTLHIQAESFPELVKEAARVLGTPPVVGQPFPIAEIKSDGEVKPVNDNETPSAKGRGRPRKTAPAGAPASVPASQAQVDSNSASAPADTSPAAEGATTGADAEASAPAAAGALPPDAPAAAPTFEQFRAALQKAGATESGLKKLTELLSKHGCAKVKDVPAEKYAEIMAEAAEIA